MEREGDGEALTQAEVVTVEQAVVEKECELVKLQEGTSDEDLLSVEVVDKVSEGEEEADPLPELELE